MRINLIGLSSGKDSTALWLWAIHESGYAPESIRGSCSETENEYDEVYAQIKALDEHGQKFGVAPIRMLRNTDPWTWNQHPLFLALAIWKKRFPSARARFCTELLKIIPTARYIQELQLEGHEIVSHSGVRRDESHERSLMEEWSDNGMLGCKVRRPLLDLKIDDVWAIHRKYKVPINPLYFTGRKRVGCRLCCMSNKQDVRVTVKTKPWVIDLYRDWEKIVGNVDLTGKRLLPEKIQNNVPTFFPATTVPPHLRSIKGLVRKRDSKRGKKGDLYDACTIDDVAKWSFTERGGKERHPNLPGLEFQEDDSHLPCQSGYCE